MIAIWKHLMNFIRGKKTVVDEDNLCSLCGGLLSVCVYSSSDPKQIVQYCKKCGHVALRFDVTGVMTELTLTEILYGKKDRHDTRRISQYYSSHIC